MWESLGFPCSQKSIAPRGPVGRTSPQFSHKPLKGLSQKSQALNRGELKGQGADEKFSGGADAERNRLAGRKNFRPAQLHPLTRNSALTIEPRGRTPSCPTASELGVQGACSLLGLGEAQDYFLGASDPRGATTTPLGSIRFPTPDPYLIFANKKARHGL